MGYTPKSFSGHSEPMDENVKHSDLNDMVKFYDNELQAVSRAFQETDVLELRETGKEPPRPADGMIVLADGVGWDPGEGAGHYMRQNGAWVFMGSGSAGVGFGIDGGNASSTYTDVIDGGNA